jgi:lysophospholipase L1-like esterase
MTPRDLFPVSDDGTRAAAFVAIGDSFTEGLNDPAPGGGFHGWADRLAGMLAAEYPGLRYANLAVRGKLLRQIVAEQVPAALDLLADSAAGSAGATAGSGLVSIAAGGNDILRPGGDPDTLAELFDAAVARLRAAGCEVMMFTGFDPQAFALMKLLRGRIAAYNMHLRAIADDHGCYLVDLWSMRFLRETSAWSPDRLHLTSASHLRIALRACEVLGVPVAEDWRALPDLPLSSGAASAESSGTLEDAGPVAVASASLAPAPRAEWIAARREDARWAREYLVPWVSRRLHGTSSGDGLPPKRPALQAVTPPIVM